MAKPRSLHLKFFGHKLRKSTTALSSEQKYVARIGKGHYKSWRVEVWWVPGGEARHGSQQEFPPTWRASLEGPVMITTAGFPEAALALEGLEESAKRVYTALGALVPRRDAHPPWA